MDIPASVAAISWSSDLAAVFARLLVHLRTVPDHRHRRGIVHPLGSVLGLPGLGLMTGCRNRWQDVARVQENDASAHVLHLFAHEAALVLDQTLWTGALGEADAAKSGSPPSPGSFRGAPC